MALASSLDPVPAEKKPRMEGDNGDANPLAEGEDGAAAGEGGENGEKEKEQQPEPEINFVKPQKPFVK